MNGPIFSTLAVNAKADALGALLDGGVLELCDGEQPASADTVVNDYAPLARLAFAEPAFKPAVDGVIEAYPLTPEDAAPGQGTARWFRCLTADGHPVVDGAIATHDAPFLVSSTAILIGTRVTIDSFRLMEPKG